MGPRKIKATFKPLNPKPWGGGGSRNKPSVVFIPIDHMKVDK
jgi:hypothetical protein